MAPIFHHSCKILAFIVLYPVAYKLTQRNSYVNITVGDWEWRDNLVNPLWMIYRVRQPLGTWARREFSQPSHLTLWQGQVLLHLPLRKFWEQTFLPVCERDCKTESGIAIAKTCLQERCHPNPSLLRIKPIFYMVILNLSHQLCRIWFI